METFLAALGDTRCDRICDRFGEQVETFAREVLRRTASEIPEVVGPDPVLRQLAAKALDANLDNLRAALRCRAGLDNPFVPPAVPEYARMLAQRGVEAKRLLASCQLQKRLVTGTLIEHAAAVVNDHSELARTLHELLRFAFAYLDASTQAALASYSADGEKWRRMPSAGLAHRVATVLGGGVTNAAVAEEMIGYPVSGRHVAVMLWEDTPSHRIDLVHLPQQLHALPGVEHVLVVPKDERSFHCWLLTPEVPPLDQWLAAARDARLAARVAFGESATGLAGFCTSYNQSRAAGTVLALAQMERVPVVRYRDVAAIAFLMDTPMESMAWAVDVLGSLAEAGEECERLRHTLLVFLEEGENAIAAGHRLFLHRNSVKYRVDHARRLLPGPLGERRLDTLLALKLCEWVPVWEYCPAGTQPANRETHYQGAARTFLENPAHAKLSPKATHLLLGPLLALMGGIGEDLYELSCLLGL